MATFVVAHGAWSAGWGVSEIDSSHNPHITCPEVLADLLNRIAA
jgi:hypothetical protein